MPTDTADSTSVQRRKMRKIRVVADSSCDIFNLEKVELTTAPMKIVSADFAAFMQRSAEYL